MLKIIKSMNNNLAFVENDDGNEVIVSGKGIVFGKKKGDYINEKNVEYLFPVFSKEVTQPLIKLLSSVPIEYYAIARDIVDKARKEITDEINDSLYLALTDHIYGSVNQNRKGIFLKNPLEWDIKQMYPKEFEIGMFAVKYINTNFNTSLGQSEATTIAMHVLNSEGSHTENPLTYKMLEMEQVVTKFVVDYYHIDSVAIINNTYYQRFLTHVRFFIQRIFSNTENSNEDDLKMAKLILSSYPEERICIDELSKLLLTDFHVNISTQEKAYLTMHIIRIKQLAERNE